MHSELIKLKKNSYLPVAAIFTDWLVIAGCIAMSKIFNNPAVTLMAVIIIGARQHALFILVHEATHGHISPNKTVNDWASDLFCAFPLFFDTKVYRKNHLAHHRHLNSAQDPDLNRKKGRAGWDFPMSAKKLSYSIPIYILFLGPIEILAVFWGFSGFGQIARWKSEPFFLLFKLFYFSGLGVAIYLTGTAADFALYWIAPLLLVVPFVTRVRNLSEHWAISYADEKNSTREVSPSWLEGFLLTPHNVNFHLTHHTYPHIPFYRIEAAHKILVEAGEYKNAQTNGSYFIPFRGSVLADVMYGPRNSGPQEKAA